MNAAQLMAVRGLASLVEAGVPLERALGTVAELSPPHAARVLQAVRARVREGSSLSSAVAELQAFPPGVSALIRAGERGSALAPALRAAAESMEWDAELRARIGSALAYPMLLVGSTLASIMVIAGMVIPRFAELLDTSRNALPWSTTVMLGLSNGLQAHWRAVGLFSAVLITGGIVLYDTPNGRHVAHSALRILPVLRSLREQAVSARICARLSALLRSGVPILQAIDSVRQVANDAVAESRLTQARNLIATGSRLSAALSQSRSVSPLGVQLVRVGEGIGKVAEMLERASRIESEHVRRQIDTAVRMLEPMLILGIAALVAFVAASLLQAVYSVRPF